MDIRFSLSGTVIPHLKRGRTLGYPTANIPVESTVEDGLYVGYISFENQQLAALIFIGAAITFGETDKKAEVFILDFNDDLYGKEIQVAVIKKLRENIKFNSAEELVAQMKEDEREAREYFTSIKN